MHSHLDEPGEKVNPGDRWKLGESPCKLYHILDLRICETSELGKEEEEG